VQKRREFYVIWISDSVILRQNKRLLRKTNQYQPAVAVRAELSKGSPNCLNAGLL